MNDNKINTKSNSKNKKNNSSKLYNQFLLLTFLTTISFLYILHQHEFSIGMNKSITAPTNAKSNTKDNKRNDHNREEIINHHGSNKELDKRDENKIKMNFVNFISTPTKKETNKEKITTSPNYHLVFSTDCTEYQRWQSYLFFHNAFKIKQPCKSITRIVSGCDTKQQQEDAWHKTHIQTMDDKYHIHFTPKFSKTSTGQNYEFFNKPFGLLHYIENFYNQKFKNDNDIIFIFDPDMVLLKPISHEFGNEFVRDGKPYAQKYGYGQSWLVTVEKDIPSLWNTNDNTSNTNHKDSSLYKLSKTDAGRYYAVGPPYIGTINDIYAITKLWCTFVPNVHKMYPKLLAEMFAYSAAAAHLNLPHIVKNDFMVSDVHMGNGEGWGKYFNRNEHIKDNTLCEDVMNLNHDDDKPFVFHYCQRYIVGRHFFGKKRIPTPFFTCERRYLSVPPANISLLYDYREPPPPHTPAGEQIKMSLQEIKFNAISVCLLTKKLNDALSFFKSKHCENVDDTGDNPYDLWSQK